MGDDEMELRRRACVAIARLAGYEYRDDIDLLFREVAAPGQLEAGMRDRVHEFSLEALVYISGLYGWGFVEQVLRVGCDIAITRR